MVKTAAELKKILDDQWLAEMAKWVFQAGFVWKVIEAKWDGFEAAFEGLQSGPLALIPDDDLDRLVSDKRIICNGQKIKTVCENASYFIDLAQEHGSVAARFVNGPSDDFLGLLADMKKTAAPWAA